MSRLIVGIGIPGAGKTTYLKELAQKTGDTYINPDDIRQKISGNAADQSVNKEAWEAAYEELKLALAQKKNVIFGATFAKAHERRAFLAEAHAYGAEEIIGYYFVVPLDTAYARNKTRTRQVPEHAIRRMHTLLEKNPPHMSEGFSVLTRIDGESFSL